MAERKQTSEGTRPHYLGHRQRLRDRFLKAGPDSLADYELLELVLFQANPRGDVKPLAKALLERFGSFAAAIGASPETLKQVPGVGDAAVAAMKTAQAAALRMLQGAVMERPVLSNWTQVVQYCQASLAHEDTERFRILFLNRKNALIADEVQQKGTVDHTPVYPREIIKRALELGASAVILVHNHPSGDPTPSQTDIEMTQAIREAGDKLGIALHDHLIVATGGVSSLRTLGLI